MSRIALLVCDTLVKEVVEEHGDYPVLYSQLLANALPNQPFTLDPYDVRQQVYPEDVDKYDAIMLSGSAHSAYEKTEWITKLVEYVASIALTKSNIKIIAICFGHQIVARALGGSCVPNDGKWEVGPTPLQLTDLGKQIFGVDSLNVQSMHRDHVPTVPPTFHLLGSTTVSMNQGMVRFSDTDKSPTKVTPADVHIFTVQGHPEFTEPVMSTIIKVRTASGVLDAGTAADATRRKDWRNDGVLIGRAIWKVLGQA